MKKIIPFLLSITMILNSFVYTVPAEEEAMPVTVSFNGTVLNFDVEPAIVEGYTMVPIGQLIGFMTGVTPNWDADTKTMSFSFNGKEFKHTIGTNVMYIDGVSKEYAINSFIENERSLASVRMLADALDSFDIKWAAEIKQVVITSGKNSGSETPVTASLPFGHEPQIPSEYIPGGNVPHIQLVDMDDEVEAGQPVTIQVHALNTPGVQVSLDWNRTAQLDYTVGQSDVGAGQITFPIDLTFKEEGAYILTITVSSQYGTDSHIVNVTVK